MSSSVSNEPATPQADERRRSGRRVALLILAICAAPTVAAWLAFFVWPPQSRTNYGDLIEPRRIPDPEMRGVDGSPFRLSRLRGKWVLLQVDSGACDEACRRRLVTMRQVRLALGKDADRVERVWLLGDAATPDPALLREHEDILVARAPATLLEEFGAGDRIGYIYVLDPRGILMLRFPGDPDGRRMLRDLAHLLRVSRIG